LGLIIAGPLADWLEVQVWYVVGGIVSIAMGLIGFALPPVLQIEEHQKPPLEAVAAASPEPALEPQD
jgi:DHA3 family macrolide efflux protein-like MFS transporter